MIPTPCNLLNKIRIRHFMNKKVNKLMFYEPPNIDHILRVSEDINDLTSVSVTFWSLLKSVFSSYELDLPPHESDAIGLPRGCLFFRRIDLFATGYPGVGRSNLNCFACFLCGSKKLYTWNPMCPLFWGCQPCKKKLVYITSIQNSGHFEIFWGTQVYT